MAKKQKKALAVRVPGKKQTTVKMLNARIKELKETVKKMDLTILESRGTVSLNRDTIAQQTAVLDSITGQIEVQNRELKEAIETTARRMIELDEYNEKVRIAKVAAMNVYGTLSVVQRDLKAVIDTPGPDSTTLDTMEALLEGDLHLEVPAPTGEVPNMVETLFEELGDDAPTAGLGVRNVSDSENTDLGLIPDLGEERAASVFPDNAEFTASIPLDNSPISAMFEEVATGIADATAAIKVIEEELSQESNEGIFLEPKSEVTTTRPVTRHLRTRDN